jgi:hypothetical protein
MNDTAPDQAEPTVVALPVPCWWIDRDDCWETSHHPTREDVEADHADQIRADYGWVLSVGGAFAIVAGVARQEPLRCREVTCPECGGVNHVQRRFESCVYECEYEFEIEQIPPDDPNQARFFEILPTHDVDGEPLSRVVLFADEEPR